MLPLVVFGTFEAFKAKKGKALSLEQQKKTSKGNLVGLSIYKEFIGKVYTRAFVRAHYNEN